jgi:hypothetical protein
MKKSETSEEHLSPFERLEQFMKKLVAVPKKELDEKLFQYRQDKSEKRKNVRK